MGSPSTLGASTSGVSTSAPPASGPSPGAAGDFSKALADELQRRLDEEGWQAGNPAPGKPADESPPQEGEKAEHPLLRAGPGDLGIRFVNRDGGSPDGNAPIGQETGPSNPSQLLAFSAPGAAALFEDSARLSGEASHFPNGTSRLPDGPPRLFDQASRFFDKAAGLGRNLSKAALRGARIGAGAVGRVVIPTSAAGGAAAVAGGVGILLGSTRPAGKEPETGTTADGGHFTTDERTIDVRRADGTRQRGFLSPDGKSWSSADGTLIARRNATGAIEIEPPTASGKKSDAENQKPSGTEKEKADPVPSPGPHRSSKTESTDECRPVGPPTPEQIQRLVDEHSRSKDGDHLDRRAAESIFKHTQPDNTRVEVPGMNHEGPDIIYRPCDRDDDEAIKDTAQVKAIKGFNGFERALKNELPKELGKSPPEGSRIIAFQVPAGTTGTEKWLGRFWGDRIKNNPHGWKAKAVQYQVREVLIVNKDGDAVYRGKVYDPTKADRR